MLITILQKIEQQSRTNERSSSDDTDLVVAEMHGNLLERGDVSHREGVEQGDAGDGRHGRHRQVVRHRVRHDALHEPFRSPCAACGRGNLPGAWRGVLERNLHLATAVRTHRAARVRHVDGTAASVGAGAATETGATETAPTGGVAAFEVALWQLSRRRRWQAEEGAVGGARRRREDGGAEERVLGGAGQDVGGVELVDAGVEVGDAPDHGVLADQLDGGGDREREDGEEEVDHFLARLREQHALRPRVDQELHAQRRGGGCHTS
ncbi:unnamed protein product [Urochloa decumbens]|uniref:Uncharacterized protein n=1 Tax=Urochloa decumbens TaxID=240449 RepID=A0ABC8YZW0_9POAL